MNFWYHDIIRPVARIFKRGVTYTTHSTWCLFISNNYSFKIHKLFPTPNSPIAQFYVGHAYGLVWGLLQGSKLTSQCIHVYKYASETCSYDHLYSETTSIQLKTTWSCPMQLRFYIPLRDHLYIFLGPSMVA